MAAKILLASRSPQRRSLLGCLGIPFRVVVPRFAEVPGDPLASARGKAGEVAARAGVPVGGVVLGADTAVAVAGRMLGKPSDVFEARAMLGLLAGRAHEVLTAVAVIGEAGAHEALDVTRVQMRRMSAATIDWYLGRGEWHGRAGGYAIQGAGAAMVERIEGDYTTVVGLPLGLLGTLLAELRLAPWASGPDSLSS